MKTILFGAITSVTALLTFTGCQHSPQEATPAASTGPIELFNGKDLHNWQAVSADAKVKKEDVWSARGDMIVCQGDPIGFLYTGQDYQNFRLQVEYRWAPGSKPGNSGIFSRITDLSKALPRCIETQLMHTSAGDVLGLQGMNIETNQPRSFSVLKHKLAGDIFGVKKTQDAEKPPGEWNEVIIQAQGPNYDVWVNGAKVNEVKGVETAAGPVGLQSEGGEIHFRKVTLTPLP